MADDIWIWKYELTSSAGLNSVSNRTRHPGALIRVGPGYGCIHPWPELGDVPLGEQVKSLAEGHPTQLASISLNCARIDGDARLQGKSLFGSPIPESHWLFQDGDDIRGIREQGFSTAKLKIGPAAPNTDLIARMAEEGLRIRLDANGTFQPAQFSAWWNSLSSPIRQQIEFVEDPVPWNREDWQSLENNGVDLAADRDVEQHPLPCSWAIYKPAVTRERQIVPWAHRQSVHLAVTSYMDHPLGQMWAAFRAQLVKGRNPVLVGKCGLLTHRCFQKNEFSERIWVEGPVLRPPGGTGLGFDDLLEALPWKRLT